MILSAILLHKDSFNPKFQRYTRIFFAISNLTWAKFSISFLTYGHSFHFQRKISTPGSYRVRACGLITEYCRAFVIGGPSPGVDSLRIRFVFRENLQGLYQDWEQLYAGLRIQPHSTFFGIVGFGLAPLDSAALTLFSASLA